MVIQFTLFNPVKKVIFRFLRVAFNWVPGVIWFTAPLVKKIAPLSRTLSQEFSHALSSDWSIGLLFTFFVIGRSNLIQNRSNWDLVLMVWLFILGVCLRKTSWCFRSCCAAR